MGEVVDVAGRQDPAQQTTVDAGNVQLGEEMEVSPRLMAAFRKTLHEELINLCNLADMHDQYDESGSSSSSSRSTSSSPSSSPHLEGHKGDNQRGCLVHKGCPEVSGGA